MAAFDDTHGAHRNKKPLFRNIKRSIRVDLTPMVDLGFLLITFFMVTSSWSRPHAMALRMPAEGPPSELGEHAVLTILAARGNQVFYYNGTLAASQANGSFGVTGYSLDRGIGEVIREKQLLMDRGYKGGKKELMILIKPSRNADYGHVVALLDDMLIHGVSRYALLDISETEERLLEEKIH